MSIVKIRKLRPDDGLAAGHVFFDAIHKGTVADYSAAERDAWAGQAVDYQRWENRLVGQNGFAAVEDDEPIGFMTLNLGSGPINFAPSVCQIFSLTRNICAAIVVLFQADVTHSEGKFGKPEGRQFHFISAARAACK